MMLYRLLYFVNQLLLFFGKEIRKTPDFPGYYLQTFEHPDLPHENGVYTIPIEKIISPHFFSYDPKGWHYYAACLKEYELNPEITYQNSILKKYYDGFQPKSVANILFYDNTQKAPAILQQMPPLLIRDFWRLNGNLQEIKSQLIEEETQLFGPISDIYGEEQLIRCINAYKLIKKHGYIPERFEDGYIGGYFFLHNNDYRFLALAGKHRLAALSILGYQNIKVTCPYNLKALDFKRCQNWPTVKGKLFTSQEMMSIVEQLWHYDSNHFAEKYNLKTGHN